MWIGGFVDKVYNTVLHVYKAFESMQLFLSVIQLKRGAVF